MTNSLHKSVKSELSRIKLKVRGRGAPVNTSRQPLERYNQQQVRHFLEFVLSPSITTDIPFGKKVLHYTRIIQQYYSYCQETTSGNLKILGESSLFTILQACAASTRKSMAGIDNYAANGSTGCEGCCLLDYTLAEIELILKDNDEMTEDIRLRHLTLFNRQRNLIYEWKKHQLRAVYQEAARDTALASLDDTSVRKYHN
ncbi:unnamed protein product [Rotaria magnacalcarata]|uniref:Uncharacterized protein n=1 Tax=Rotaria magnacalcarata TaxID=392030 RepID=A0A8S2PM27_9BILA|nr:unnamed protein product [Rotaria magnacalcarata]